MAQKLNLQNAFSPAKSRATPRGSAGYDNARENIDPHVKTKVVDLKEFVQNGVSYNFGTLLTNHAHQNVKTTASPSFVSGSFSGILYCNAIGTGLDVLHSATIGNHLEVGDNLTVDTNTLFVDSVNHRVGIGNSNPQNVLDVTGAIRTSSGFKYGSATILSGAGTVQVGSGGASANVKLQTTTGSAGLYATKFGIGTTTPDSTLHIDGTGDTHALNVAVDSNSLLTIKRQSAALPTRAEINIPGDYSRLMAGGSALCYIRPNGLIWLLEPKCYDNKKVRLGSGTNAFDPTTFDAQIYYDATNLIIDPNLIGTGKVYIGITGNDTINAGAYEVAGAAGATGTFTTVDGKTVTVTNGIVVSIV